MQVTQHNADFSTAPQLAPEHMAAISSHGFRTVINNRPDMEGGPDQPTSAQMHAAAEAAGLAYHYLPVISGSITPEQVVKWPSWSSLLPAPCWPFAAAAHAQPSCG